MRAQIVTLLASAFIASCALLTAQTDTASLSGIVSDASGGAVPGAAIRLRNQATALMRTATSNAEGRYRFDLLPPGLYEVSAEAKGFKRFIAKSLSVEVAQSGTLEIGLEIGNASESLQVTAEVSLLNTESAASGTIVTAEKIVSLPLNGRQFIQLALLVPGANAGGRAVQQDAVRLNQTGGISSSGGRTNNNAFLLDGATNIDPDYNAISYMPIIDAISEFQVQTAQFSAQYGRASGSQINVVTKSGGNHFPGSAWEFLRNRALDSRPFNSVGAVLPQNQRNQFGATGGGRILRDKLWRKYT